MAEYRVYIATICPKKKATTKAQRSVLILFSRGAKSRFIVQV